MAKDKEYGGQRSVEIGPDGRVVPGGAPDMEWDSTGQMPSKSCGAGTNEIPPARGGGPYNSKKPAK